MGEDDVTFLCRACKPVIAVAETIKVAEEILKCRACNFKSTFKYNFQRHIKNQHGGSDEPEPEPVNEAQDITEEENATVAVTGVETMSFKEMKLEDFLRELKCFLR